MSCLIIPFDVVFFAFIYRDHIYTVDMDTSHTEEIYFSKVSNLYHYPETKDTRTSFK